MKTVSLELAKQLKEAGVEWRYVPGYERLYEVSNKGQIRSIARTTTPGKSLTPVLRGGYHCVSLCRDGKSRQYFIHVLVACTFMKKKDGKPYINHKDGNKLNNTVENLEWCTRSENDLHAYKMGLRKPTQGEKNGQAKLTTSDVEWIHDNKEWLTQKEMADELKVSNQHISDILKGKKWRHVYESRAKETM